jgi:hypothetical protein
MRRVKRFFDLAEYFLVRTLMLTLLLICVITLIMQHWPHH